MNDTNVIPLAQPGQFSDALTEVLRDGAARLLAAAVEAEVEVHLAAYSHLKLPDGRDYGMVVVREGLARAYTKYPFSRSAEYVRAEQEALRAAMSPPTG